MPFVTFLKTPTRYDFPQIAAEAFHYIEILRAVDLSGWDLVLPYLRLHDNTGSFGNTKFQMRLMLVPTWTDEGTSQPPFAIDPTDYTACRTSPDVDTSTVAGSLITRLDVANKKLDPAVFMAPQARILLEIEAKAGGVINGGYVIVTAGAAVSRSRA
jgi:hypothetical protein